MKKLIILIFIINISLVKAQTWRSSLYPSNWTPPNDTKIFYTDAFIQDYSYAGYKNGKEAIPTVTANIIDVTLAPYSADKTGVADATAAIQNAIDKAKANGGGVVYLPAGTYKLSAGTKDNCLSISGSNIILRGDGVGKTFLYNDDNYMNGKVIINVNSGGSNWQAPGINNTLITSDLNGPTLKIPVASVSNYSVGDWVIVRNDATDAWCIEHGETDWVSYQSSLKGLMHFRQILAIDVANKILSIDVPIRYTLKTRDNSRVYKAPVTITDVGLEDFSIGNREVVTNTNEWLDKTNGVPNVPNTLDDAANSKTTNGAYRCDNSWVITLKGMLNSWVKNVSTYKPSVNIYRTEMLSNGLLIDQCRGVTVDNVYMGFTQWGGGSGSGYGFRIQSNDCLIKNCMTEVVRHGFVFSFMYSLGNVIFQCTDKQSGLCTANSASNIKTGSSGSDFHMHFSASNLIDGMTLDASYFSVLHRKGVGSPPYHNAVTAHSTLWNTKGINSTGNVIRTSQTRLGYIMGTSGSGATGVDYKVADNGPAFRYDVGGVRTSPEDIVEGIGEGATLEPQSLYLDQLSKRSNTNLSFISITKEAEDYDSGGQNVGYYDTTTGNTGGSNYRTTEDVDIGISAGASKSLAVTNFVNTEYLNYTFNVVTAGNYKVNVWAANRNQDLSNCDISMDGGPIKNIGITRTLDWEVYAKNTSNDEFFLSVGPHKLKLEQKLSGSSNIDQVGIEQIYSGGTTAVSNDLKLINNIKIYPNPVNDIIHISVNSTKAQLVSFQLISLEGKILQSQQNKLRAGVNDLTFKPNSVFTGVYILNVGGLNINYNTKIYIDKNN